MRRTVIFALLSLLLLAQHQAYVHPIEHLVGHAPAQEATFSSPEADEECAFDALLAGGFSALHIAPLQDASGTPPDQLVFHSYRSRAAEVPAWFESRAPPVLL
jgi:hypothetical protein